MEGLLVSLRDAVLLICAVLLCVLLVGLVISLPDLKRYLRLKSM